MSYDTEHVRNAGEGTIAGIPTFTELLTNPDLAALYTSLRRSSTATAPELTETAAVSKKTVYEYLHRLERAGLVTETDASDEPSVYEAEGFELTLTVRDVEVSITPALVAAVAHENVYPVITRVREDHGLVTLALAHDLVMAHNEGEVTVRQIATLTGLSTGTAYDLLEALYEVRGLGDDDAGPTTFTPADVTDAGAGPRDGSTDE